MQSATDGISHQITIGFLCFVARLSPSLDGMTPATIFPIFFFIFEIKDNFAKCRPFIFGGFSVPT